MSNNEDDPVTGRSEQADGTRYGNGEVEPKYARSERLDRRSAPLPEPTSPGGGPPVTTVVVRQKAPKALWAAVIAVIVLLVVVIIVLLLRPTGSGGGEAATTSATATSTSSTSARPAATTSLPTTSAGTTSQPTTSTAPAAPAGGSIPPTVTLTFRSYVDLDTMYPSTESNGQDEIWVDQNGLNFAQSGMWSKTRVVLVPTGGISQDACNHSTVLATGGRIQKDQVGSDQSMCVSTSGGKWVVLTSTDHHFSADDANWYDQYTFATQVFPGPQPT